MTDTTQLDTDTARLVASLADLNAQIADLTERAEVLKAELRALPPADYTIDGRPALRITPTRRFDPEKGLQLVPEDLRESCYSKVVDAKKVREYLAPALADACMVDAGKPKVTVL